MLVCLFWPERLVYPHTTGRDTLACRALTITIVMHGGLPGFGLHFFLSSSSFLSSDYSVAVYLRILVFRRRFESSPISQTYYFETNGHAVRPSRYCRAVIWFIILYFPHVPVLTLWLGAVGNNGFRTLWEPGSAIGPSSSMIEGPQATTG